jgi:hypothetical protein
MDKKVHVSLIPEHMTGRILGLWRGRQPWRFRCVVRPPSLYNYQSRQTIGSGADLFPSPSWRGKGEVITPSPLSD